MKLSTEQLNHFQNHGYLVIDDFFTLRDMKAFTEAVRAIIHFQCTKAGKIDPGFPEIMVGDEFSSGMTKLEELDHSFIADISDYLASLPETLKLLSNPTLKPVINQLLDEDENSPLYITNTNPILALPLDTDYTYTWHKDTFYTIPESQYIQVWAPLIQNSNHEIGTLKICPGSHKNGWHGQETVEGVPNRHRYRVSNEELAKFKPMEVVMNLGQMLFFDSGLAHSSGLNTSEFARFSLVGVYHKITNEKFSPLIPRYAFKAKTPENYFNELYKKKENH